MIHQLTALRAVLAYWVVLFHFVGTPFAPDPLPLIQPLIANGDFGVDGFFILSGLIIAHTYAERFREGRADYASFMWARFARIYPAHLTVMVAFLFLYAASRLLQVGEIDPAAYSMRDFAMHIFMVDAWGTTTGLSWNQPSWSISAEWFAYLLAPVLLLRLHVRRVGLQGVALVACLGALGALEVTQEAGILVTNGYALVRVSAEFSLGVMIASWSTPNARRNVPGLLLSVGTLALGMVLSVQLLIVLAMALAIRVLFEWPVRTVPLILRRLGEWSFGIYLTQALVPPVLNQVASATGRAGSGMLLLSLVMVTMLGALLYSLVERPARRSLQPRVRAGGSSSEPAVSSLQGADPLAQLGGAGAT